MATHASQLNTPELLYTSAKDVSQIVVQEIDSGDESQAQDGVSTPGSTEDGQEIPTQESVERLLAVDEHERMKEFCKKRHVTKTQALLAALHAFLVRYTDEEEGKKSYTIHQYPQATFGEEFALDIDNDVSESFDGLLRDMRSLSYRRLGSETVPRDCKPPFAYDPLLVSTDLWIIIVTEKIALEAIGNSNAGLRLRLIYQSSMYGLEEMDRSMENFLCFWSSILASSHVSLLALSLCGEKELSRQRRFYWSQNVTMNTWDHLSVVDKFLEVAHEHPQNTAALTSDGETLTYEGLVHRSCEIASCLQEAGASPGDSIGLLCQPGLDEIAGMIGILMSRCGYVAIDPSFAVERLSFMMDDSKVPMILVAPDLTILGTEVVEKSQSSPQIIQFPEHHPAYSRSSIRKTSPQDPFYTIYTSVRCFFYNLSGNIIY